MNSPFLLPVAPLGAVLFVATRSIAAALDLTFPTKNRALLQGDGEGFYMFIDRDFQGEKSMPWQGRQYGYVAIRAKPLAGSFTPAFTKAPTSSRWNGRVMANLARARFSTDRSKSRRCPDSCRRLLAATRA